MKLWLTLIAGIVLLPLAACKKSPSDKLVDRAENAADDRVDALEDNAAALREQAAALDNRADRTRDVAGFRAEAMQRHAASVRTGYRPPGCRR